MTIEAGEWDYVVAGGGTAGCVIAARLTQTPGIRVLLLEAGGEYPLALSVPLPGMRQVTSYSWKYFTCQQAGLGHRKISFPFGRVLGGSSSVNAMIYTRGSPAVYDAWEQAGNAAWSFDAVLPYFRKPENQQRGASLYHGAGGPVDISDPRHLAPFSRAFVEACVEHGWPYTEDFNGPQAEGAGFFQVTQRRGRRVSTSEAYLGPARRRRGLQVESEALVTRILVEKQRATGVEFVDGAGGVRVARAGREVILSAGALNSPKLLMLSGIGPAEHLRSLGIRPSVDLPGVGRALQDHVRVPVLYESGKPSPGDMLHWAPGALNYILRRRGVMTSNCCESGAFIRAESQIPDLQFVTHFQSSLYPGTVDLQFCLMRTRSRGKITLASADPLAPPVIDPCYFTAPEDMALARRGLLLARELARTRALKRFPLRAEVLPGGDVRTDREMDGYIRSTAETCYHPAGTCRMGSDAEAVVDDQLRVRGVDGLRVMDASIMPELPNGNTCAPTLMIAEKGSDLLMGAWEGPC